MYIYIVVYFIYSLIGIQEKLGIMNNGEVYAVFSYEAQQSDELTFDVNDQLIILRKGDDAEREWWWAKMKQTGNEGYVPRNLLGVSEFSVYKINSPLKFYCLLHTAFRIVTESKRVEYKFLIYCNGNWR